MSSDAVSDWAAARSDKWRRQLAGLEAMLAPIDGPLLDALDVTAPARIADIGCGGGATTLEAARRVPAGSVVHGYDLSAALIEVARRRSAGRTTVAFDVADAAHASPSAAPYDRLVSRLGVMFFDDDLAAFRNLRGWLAPGGSFAFAVWGPLSDNEWMLAARESVAPFVDLPPVDLSVPGPFRYANVTPLLTVLQRAGFVDLLARDWRGTLAVGGGLAAPDAAVAALASFSTFAEQLSEAGPEATHGAHRLLTDRFRRCERGGVVATPARVHVVTGRTEQC